MSRRTIPLLAALVLLFAHAASAVTVRVPEDQPTVQAGVDAAQPGDVVLISGGPYSENVVIDARSGITLKGKGKPTIGGVGDTILNIRGGSTGVVVDGIVFDTAAMSGVLIQDSSDVTVKRCEVRNVEDGIRMEASSNVLVEKNRLESIGNDAIDMDTASGTVGPNSNCRILKNRVSNSDEDGITLNGRGHWVAKNRLELITEDGIETNDPNAIGLLIEKNRLDRIGRNGMEIEGSAHTISKNRLKNTGEEGIQLRSDDSLIEKNRIDMAGDDGIDVGGSDNDIVKNKVKKANEDGIEVGSGDADDYTGNTFEKNSVTQSGDNGFQVSDPMNTFIKNKATKSSGFGLLDNSGGVNTYEANKFDSESVL